MTTIRSDGAVEINAKSSHDPAQAKEITFSYESDTVLKIKMRGTDNVVRSVSLTLS